MTATKSWIVIDSLLGELPSKLVEGNVSSRQAVADIENQRNRDNVMIVDDSYWWPGEESESCTRVSCHNDPDTVLCEDKETSVKEIKELQKSKSDYDISVMFACTTDLKVPGDTCSHWACRVVNGRCRTVISKGAWARCVQAVR